MLTRRIIPCLDVRDGRVVKGVKFQSLRDMGDPAELAARYELEGADEIVMLDVSATNEGRATAVRTVERIRAALSIPLTVGGGVRTLADAGVLLDAGADRVSVNTAAVLRPALLTELAERFGVQCIVIAIDAARASDHAQAGRLCHESPQWFVSIRSGSEDVKLDAVAWAKQAASLGAGEVLLTSRDRDGTRSGYDCGLLRAVSSAVHVPVVASGGASGPEHLLEGLQAGADAVLAASIFHEAQYSIGTVKDYLAQRGVEVRR